MDASSSTYYGLYANLKDESTNKTKEKNLKSYFIDKIRTTIKSLLSDINNDLQHITDKKVIQIVGKTLANQIYEILKEGK